MIKKFLLLALFTAALFKIEAGDQIAKHVIVIGIDGMSPDGIMNASTPVMDEMMKNGAYTLKARAVLPTSSSTNWASMMMGAGPEQHGITSNGWEPDDFILPPVVTGSGSIFPTIFSVIREQKPDAETAAIYHWTGFGRLFEKDAPSYDVTADTEYETTELVADYVKSKKPFFLFIQLDHVDHAGHEYGHGTEEYYKSVERTDSLIGRIVQSTKEAGIFEETTFLVTSDHGGIGFGHGGETLEEIEIPFILYGKGIKKAHPVKHTVYTYDNAATCAFALNIERPYAWIGRPLKSAFEGYESPKVLNEKAFLNKPIIYPKKKFYDPAGGLFIDKNATVKIESTDENTEIRYTLDGTRPTRESKLYEGKFKLNESAVVSAKAFRGKDEESLASTAFYRLIKSDGDNGINYKYYEGEGWSVLPVFESLTPLRSGTVYEFRMNVIDHRESYYAICYESYLRIDKAGEYKFYTSSDDGSKLYIDGKEVVDNDGDHGVKERSGSIELTEGKHKIKVLYFNGGGGAWLDVFYKGPGIPKQIIPANKLFLEE
ncbi:MAG: alkaline phosphatase family protein [Ignavibacteria bacterium]